MSDTFIAEWGFCPHPEQLLVRGRLCPICEVEPSQRSFSQEDASRLTHETQVAIFGWCGCEDGGANKNPYADCPS